MLADFLPGFQEYVEGGSGKQNSVSLHLTSNLVLRCFLKVNFLTLIS